MAAAAEVRVSVVVASRKRFSMGPSRVWLLLQDPGRMVRTGKSSGLALGLAAVVAFVRQSPGTTTSTPSRFPAWRSWRPRSVSARTASSPAARSGLPAGGARKRE